MTNNDSIPAAELAVPGCPGCVRLLARVEKLEAELRELRELVLKLQARLDQDSSNSSKPPSSDPPWTPPKSKKVSSGRKPGGQPGHEAHNRERQPKNRVTNTVEYHPSNCERCGKVFVGKISSRDPEPRWHQVWEIPAIVADLVEYLAHARTCACGHVTWAEIPTAIRKSIVGPNLAALLSYMTGRCHESKRTVQEFVGDVFGVSLSLGTITNIEREVQAALASGYKEVLTAVREAPAKNVDETGWYEKSRLCWLWTAATTTSACFQIQAKRGREGLKKFLGDVVKGIIGSDRWGGYAGLLATARQICWAHLKRDFQKLIDGGDPIAARTGLAGLKVVKDLFHIWHEHRNGMFGRRALKKRMGPIQARMTRILRRGRDGPDAKTARFCKRVLKIRPALWTFLDHEGVEPTNNHAERQLRPAVLWRKRSFGNASAEGCRFTERILTATQTLRLQKRSVFRYLSEVVIAHRSGVEPPSLLATATVH